MTCPLDKLSTDPGVSSVQVIKQLDTMIKNNITVIAILLIILGVLGFGLYFFSKSLFNTLSKYYDMKTVNKTSNSESLKDKAADNEEYPEQPDPNNPEEEDLKIVVDPSKFMPKAKRDFVTKLTLQNKEYNQAKTDFVTRKLNYDENDDIVDSKILYKDYDNYNYDYSTD
jgi:hypothetical protein